MRPCLAAVVVLSLLAGSALADVVVFEEDFENGISSSQWPTQGTGIIKTDPHNPNNKVLGFSAVRGNGDIWSKNVAGTTFTVSFDYLGHTQPGSGQTPGDYGGFVFYASSTQPNRWFAGTSAGPNNQFPNNLIDDNTWHHYEFTFANFGGLFSLSLEDWIGSGGIAGDALFDNIKITTTTTDDNRCILFAETFQTGTFDGTLWTTIGSGQIVTDPKSSSNKVLNFSRLSGGADISTQILTSPTGTFVVSFDYLGHFQLGQPQTPNDYGGFVFYASSTQPNRWFAGSSAGPSNQFPNNLIDDNTWHHYEFTFNFGGLFSLAFQDWSGSGGIPGDALFDNIVVKSSATCSDTEFTPAPPTPHPPSPVPLTPSPATPSPSATPTPEPPRNVCNDKCMYRMCFALGEKFEVTVLGAEVGSTWGTTIYTEDSVVGVAAVHAGVVSVGESKLVTITCAGPQSGFPGSTQNGITTATYGAYEHSFTFGAVAGPEPNPHVCYHEPCMLNKCKVQGTEREIYVFANSPLETWGTDVYSDDSNVGKAAVHAGVLPPGGEGFVKVACSGRSESFTGSERNSVTTASFAQPWDYTFTLTAGRATVPPAAADECSKDCANSMRCPAEVGLDGMKVVIPVSGSNVGTAWGSNPYTDDSSIQFAAVHAGLLEVGETELIEIACSGAAEGFTGSTAHGITTQHYGNWPRSITLSAAAGPAPVNCVDKFTCMINRCLLINQRLTITVQGMLSNEVWGSGPFTDDSNIGATAVFQGLVAVGETKALNIQCVSATSFAGGENNGVTTQSYGAWPRAFQYI